MAEWKVEYDNDEGPGGEGFSEFWNITDGVKVYKTYNKDDADWLCRVLNTLEEIK